MNSTKNGDADSRKSGGKVLKLNFMIADVIEKNGQYYTLDQDIHKITHKWVNLDSNLFGNLI
jgi:hypothetical protein